MKKPSQNKMPNHIQVDTVSPATKLLEKRRQMYEVHEAFDTQKTQYKAQEEAFKRQEDTIRERDLQIQEELIRYCKFLQENEAKKNRAEARFNEEHKARLAKEQDIDVLNTQLVELQKNSSKLERKVQALRKYEDYLDSVIKAHSDQYSELSDLLNRHAVLEKSHRTLKDAQSGLESQLEKLRGEATHFEKEKLQEIVELRNHLDDLQEKLTTVDNKKNKLQSQVEETSELASLKNLTLGKILMAIDNLHTRCLEGIKRIKDDAKKEDKINEKIEKKKEGGETTKARPAKDGKDKGDNATNDEPTDNYHLKGEKAVDKLKDIAAFMSDFQEIINSCRQEEKKLIKDKR